LLTNLTIFKMSETLNYANPSAKQGEAGIEQLHALLASQPQKKLGVALVGLSNYSTEQLAPALQETKFCHLAGIATGSSSKIPEWKNKYSIPDTNIYTYENFDEISNNPEIDIVYIVLPNALHAEYVIRAAAAGKHVICEKPMALTVSQCDDMIAACKEAGKLLSIGYRLQYDPYHNEIKKMGRERVFGELTGLHAKHGIKNMEGWRQNKEIAGGGPLMDLGIYCIQAARTAIGAEPIAVKVLESKIKNANSKDEIEEFLSWEMEFPGGVMAKNETSYNSDMNLLHVTAEHGWMELSPAYSYKDIKGKTATGFLNFPPVNQQALQMDDFALSVLRNEPVKCPGELGRKDIKIIEAIYKSMKTGERIELAE
jgi:predicted dehydrogenase